MQHENKTAGEQVRAQSRENQNGKATSETNNVLRKRTYRLDDNLSRTKEPNKQNSHKGGGKRQKHTRKYISQNKKYTLRNKNY